MKQVSAWGQLAHDYYDIIEYESAKGAKGQFPIQKGSD